MKRQQKKTTEAVPKPSWLRLRLPSGSGFEQVRSLMCDGGLHTVCQEAVCPNIWECYSKKTATFLILGNRCTRNCRFCAVEHGPGAPLEADEPHRVAEAARRLGLRYVVVTSVTRDDLPDGGAGVFAQTIRAIRRAIPGVQVEVLIPDFKGSKEALMRVLEAGPHVLNHNMETVRRLYPGIRPEADYERSLELIRRASEVEPTVPTKSGMMLGLGETEIEIEVALKDLRSVRCRILTLVQYLRRGPSHAPVVRYVPPDAFERWREYALNLGFEEAASAPLVRSSYHADHLYHGVLQQTKESLSGIGNSK